MMLRISFALLSAISSAYSLPNIQIFDSRINKTKTWILIDECPVELEKNRLNDFNYVKKRVQEICSLDLGK